MGLMVLGESLIEENASYKGTYREEPYYQDHLPESHRVNQAFLWYVHRNEETVTDQYVERMRALVKEYHTLDPPKDFEFIEVVDGDGRPQLKGELLGYDLSACCAMSALAWPMRPEYQLYIEAGSADAPSVLLDLWVAHFRPRLNVNGLFPSKEIADECLCCAKALIDIDKDTFDIPKDQLEVVGLYRLPV